MPGGCRVRYALVPHVISIDVIPIAGKQRREGQVEFDVGTVGREDGAEGEEMGMGIMSFVMGDGGDVATEVGAQVAGWAHGGVGKVHESLVRGVTGVWSTGEDVDAEGAVHGDGLFEVDDVGVGDTGGGDWWEDAAGSERGVVGVGEEERGLGGVCVRRPVEDVGLVRDTVPGGELAVFFEGLDEGVFFLRGVGADALVGRADFACAGLARGEEFGVAGVEVEEGFCDVFPFGFVAGEDGALEEAGLDAVDFPGEVLRIEEGCVHTLACFGGVGVAGIATHEHTVVERVAFGDALANRVNRVPFNCLPLDMVRLEDALSGLLDLIDCCRLPWIKVWVRG